MFQSYLLTTLRHFTRHKTYAVISILGLAIGQACFLLILSWVLEELNYDQWNEKGDRIYRMALHPTDQDRSDAALVPNAYSYAVKASIPEVESVVRLFKIGRPLYLQKGDEIIEEKNRLRADSTFFDIFSLPLLSGDPATALKLPNTAVLTASTAIKYFGSTNAVGKILKGPKNNSDLLVTGVCADLPKNSHLSFDLLLSTSEWKFLKRRDYIAISAYTYLLLKPGTSPATVTSKFPATIEQYAGEVIRDFYGSSYEDLVKQGKGYHYFLQPLKDIHLHSNLEYEIKPNGSMLKVKVFIIIALFILLIACINFINLAVARADERSREAGIRKTLGSERSQLAVQFFVEAITISLLSTVLAILLAVVLAPYFSLLDGKSILASSLFTYSKLPLLFLLSILIGLLSGAYPALLFSKMKPIQILNRRHSQSSSNNFLRKGLVIFQFGISAALIIGTLVVNHQLVHMNKQHLGFNKDFVITLTPGQFLNRTQNRSFQNELVKLPNVVSTGGSNSIPGHSTYGLRFKTKDGADVELLGRGLSVDKGFRETMEIELIEGRDFSESFPDSLSVMLSESAAAALCPDGCVGTRLYSKAVFMNYDPEEPSIYTVIGVVKDINFQSLHNKITPTFFIHHSRFRQSPHYISLRIKPTAINETIDQVQQSWKQFLPANPFEYAFFDKHLEKLYHNEQQFKEQFTWFSILAIFLACFGLWGLAAYTIHRRSKEFSVRRIVGASPLSLLQLLWKEYLILILIAMVLAIPISWYAMNNWLQNFAYATTVKWWMFVVAAFLILVIALFTVAYHSFKAALINPVHTLRNE